MAADVPTRPQLQKDEIAVPTQLVIEADSLLSLVRYRFRTGVIPDDVCLDLERVSGALRNLVSKKPAEREP